MSESNGYIFLRNVQFSINVKKFTKQVAVAPNSLLAGASDLVFRDKAHGDVRKANKKSADILIFVTRLF